MKKILFIVAVIFLAAFNRSHANAEMLLLETTNGGEFTFDSAVGGSRLVTNGDNGLSDLAIILGYRQDNPLDGTSDTRFIRLGAGQASVNPSNSNQGSFEFETVTFNPQTGGPVSVNATANFQLVDATGATNTDVGHHVIYDLELTTLGVNGGNAGALQSFVGFDFNGNGADAGQLPPIISGFGTSDLAIGGNGRVLAGDFTFDDNAGPGGIVASNSSNFETFSGPIDGDDGDLDARFNGSPDGAFGTGDLAFGSFTDFNIRTVPDTFTAGGVVGFASVGTATIPEPSTLLMASMGLGMVAFRRRKRA